jgi:hypothetical protein
VKEIFEERNREINAGAVKGLGGQTLKTFNKSSSQNLKSKSLARSTTVLELLKMPYGKSQSFQT